MLAALPADDHARKLVLLLLRRLGRELLCPALDLSLYSVEGFDINNRFVGIGSGVLGKLAFVNALAFRNVIFAIKPLQKQIARVIAVPQN